MNYSPWFFTQLALQESDAWVYGKFCFKKIVAFTGLILLTKERHTWMKSTHCRLDHLGHPSLKMTVLHRAHITHMYITYIAWTCTYCKWHLFQAQIQTKFWSCTCKPGRNHFHQYVPKLTSWCCSSLILCAALWKGKCYFAVMTEAVRIHLVLLWWPCAFVSLWGAFWHQISHHILQFCALRWDECLAARAVQPSSTDLEHVSPSSSASCSLPHTSCSTVHNPSFVGIIGIKETEARVSNASDVHSIFHGAAAWAVVLELTSYFHLPSFAHIPFRLLGIMFILWLAQFGMALGMALSGDRVIMSWVFFSLQTALMLPPAVVFLWKCTN